MAKNTLYCLEASYIKHEIKNTRDHILKDSYNAITAKGQIVFLITEHQEKGIIFVLRIISIKITFLFVTDLIICVQLSPNI